MLYKASITADLLGNEDKLVEQLYIFLRAFVNSKLIYESADDKEDCVQDTILHLLNKLRSLSPKALSNLNLEQYIYNRANSYISSIWLGKLNRYRRRLSKPLNELNLLEHNGNLDTDDNYLTIASGMPTQTPSYIDTVLLIDIIEEYKLDSTMEELVYRYAINNLIKLGYTGTINEIDKTENHVKVAEILAYTVVDEYLIRTAETIDQ